MDSFQGCDSGIRNFSGIKRYYFIPGILIHMLRIELAPMEGITTYIYRNALCKYYGGVDTYFSPFISTHEHKELNFKEKKEILPDNNIGYTLIPQVLTADADEFLYTAGQISQYGYDHINLNFGCPSGTVTAKGKGSGALVNTDKLECLLDEILSRTSLKISVKTRMGYSDYSEWERIFSIYEKFPLEELIVHARVREDFYNFLKEKGFYVIKSQTNFLFAKKEGIDGQKLYSKIKEQGLSLPFSNDLSVYQKPLYLYGKKISTLSLILPVYLPTACR